MGKSKEIRKNSKSQFRNLNEKPVSIERRLES